MRAYKSRLGKKNRPLRKPLEDGFAFLYKPKDSYDISYEYD